MFAILDNLEKELAKEVKDIENKWDKEPRKDYYFHEICGINKAMDIVERFKSKELLELDMWAQNFIKTNEEGVSLND
tara:strand:- start:1754 stop:1984 length:231 start_codon:yes stop_codon:yes gene_type:complete